MLARLTTARLPQILGVRFSSGVRSGGSDKFGQKERAEEEQYNRKREQELLKKMRANIDKKKAELDALEKEHDEVATQKSKDSKE